MSAAKVLLVVLALAVIGVLGWRLSSGSRTAAQASGRCLDPRQAGCRGGDIARPGREAQVAQSKVAVGTWRGGGGAIAGGRPGAVSGSGTVTVPSGSAEIAVPGAASSGGFDVPRATLAVASALSGPSAAAEAQAHPADALRATLSDLLRGMPRDVTARGLPAEGLGKITEYVDGSGQVLLRVDSELSGTVVQNRELGVVYQVGSDGAVRGEAALLDAREAPARRAERLTARWGLPRRDAASLGKSAVASAAYIDLRRAGLSPRAALTGAQVASRPLPKYEAWRGGGGAGQLGESQARSFYQFLSEAPVLSQLLGAVLGEPAQQAAERFGFSAGQARQFLEGATSTDLRLGVTLPRAVLPRSGGALPKSLRALVGDPAQAVTAPLCLAPLQQAVDQPDEVTAALSRLPSEYPYVLLSEAGGAGEGSAVVRPVVVGTATILSWSNPVEPGSADALARLGVLPVDAPVALRAKLTGAELEALGLRDRTAGLAAAAGAGAGGGGAPELSLHAFALAGPLRERLGDDAGVLPWTRGLFVGAQERPPAAYFADPTFVYAAILGRPPGGATRILARRGIPSVELLHLQDEQDGLPALLPATGGSPAIPADAPAELRGALEAVYGAHGRAFESVRRHRDVLSSSALGREVLSRFRGIEGQVAMVGLVAACMTQGRCPLPGLRRPEDGALVLDVLAGVLPVLRQRALLVPVPLVQSAQVSDRLGELLAAVDRLRAVLSARRRLRVPRDEAARAAIAGYVRAVTGEAPQEDVDDEGVWLVRDVKVAAYQQRLAVLERGGAVVAAELDAEGLVVRRDRGEVPADVGQLVQRYGEALQQAAPVHLLKGESQVRGAGQAARRVRQRLLDGVQRVSVVQTLDGAGELRDVEVLVTQPGGEVDGYSYGEDGGLVTKAGGAVPLGGSGCRGCHGAGEDVMAVWRGGAGGSTWLLPVAAASLKGRAQARRAAELR